MYIFRKVDHQLSLVLLGRGMAVTPWTRQMAQSLQEMVVGQPQVLTPKPWFSMVLGDSLIGLI